MIVKEFVIKDKMGLHARPASNLIKVITKYNCEGVLKFKNKVVDIKSLLNVMSLCVSYNDKITIEITGEQEYECMENIEETMQEEQLI